MELNVLELFSGIGGMHCALNLSGVSGQIIAAADINTVANTVYAHNYPATKLLNSNIQKFTPNLICNLKVNTILMSPPGQPFTRNGLQKDVADKRSDALNHICEILPNLHGIDYIIMENVKAFQTSTARQVYIDSLSLAGFYYQEFILSPSQFGVPNTRYRYYCIARRCKEFSFKSSVILLEIPLTANDESADNNYGLEIADYIMTTENDTEMLVPDKILSRYAWQFDIVCPTSRNSICFTKAYTHYVEGTGSIFCPYDKVMVQQTFDKLKLDPTLEVVAELKKLHLRYFTPTEVAKLMCFPISDDDGNLTDKSDRFSFPKLTTNRQRYRLLGNSINVHVVSELIKLLLLI